mgnify:CR=1 FL=1
MLERGCTDCSAARVNPVSTDHLAQKTLRIRETKRSQTAHCIPASLGVSIPRRSAVTDNDRNIKRKPNENLARELWKMLETSLGKTTELVFVKVIETHKNAFGYGGPHPSRIRGALF